MTIQVGVVGAGGMGACHARNIAALPGASLAWVADPDEHGGQALAAELDCEWVSDGTTALDRCDALVVACPDRFHGAFVQAALARSLPTLCEKPLTVELADARAIVDAEVALGRRLIQLGFMRVYDERHRQVAEAVAPLGSVHHIRCTHRNTNDGSRAVEQMLVESMIHDIHSVRWLAGDEIVEVSTAAVQTDGATRMVIVHARLAGGGLATIEFDDIAAGYEVAVEVTADQGTVTTADPTRATIRTAGRVGAEIGDDWFAPFLDTYRIEMEAFLASVEAGGAVGPSAWDGYAAQAVADTAANAERSGTPVSVLLPEKPAIYATTETAGAMR